MPARVYNFSRYKLIKELKQLQLDYALTFEYCARNDHTSYLDFHKLLDLQEQIRLIQEVLDKED